MWVLSALSDVGGGFGVLSFWLGVSLVAIWSFILIALAMRSAPPATESAEIMMRMESLT